MKLVLLALALVFAVLGWQVSQGGGDFVPRASADPCRERPAPPIPAELEPLAERVVLVGLDEAACDLGVSRERLVLDLAERDERPDPQVLQDGLGRAVDRLEFPPVSDLLPSVVDRAGLPGIAESAIDAVPDAVVDDLLPTEAVLRRAVDRLDVTAILDNLDDPASLEPLLRDAILEAAREEIVAGLPEPIRSLID